MELHNSCFSPNIIVVHRSKEGGMGGICSTNGKMKNAYNLVLKSERKDHFEDLGIERENNINKDLKVIVYKIVDWIHLAPDRDR
jgi:hypothetical protein